MSSSQPDSKDRLSLPEIIFTILGVVLVIWLFENDTFMVLFWLFILFVLPCLVLAKGAIRILSRILDLL